MTQGINFGEDVEESLKDLQLFDNTNASGEQKGEIRQNISHRVICTYHPGHIREKVLQIQDINRNANHLDSGSHVVCCI